MRPWIEYLILNQSAYNDFIQYMDEGINHLAASAVEALDRDDLVSAKNYSSERNMYLDLKRSVAKEHRERISQNNYNEQFKERS
jgi:hypothetical protein